MLAHKKLWNSAVHTTVGQIWSDDYSMIWAHPDVTNNEEFRFIQENRRGSQNNLETENRMFALFLALYFADEDCNQFAEGMPAKIEVIEV